MSREYIAKNGSVIHVQTQRAWYTGFSQKMAEQVAEVFNSGELDRLIYPEWRGWKISNEIIGVKPKAARFNE